MEALISLSRSYSDRFLRLGMGVVLAWIGALKFADPAPVVQLLQASLPFLAFDAFVYLLGIVEVVGAALVVAGVGLPWVGVVLMGLFAGTLTIFAIAPGVTYGDAGFPFLTLAGEFLLKDLVLFAVGFALVGEAADVPGAVAQPARRVAQA
jgi:uncharacterized membrane protein YkgB